MQAGIWEILLLLVIRKHCLENETILLRYKGFLQEINRKEFSFPLFLCPALQTLTLVPLLQYIAPPLSYTNTLLAEQRCKRDQFSSSIYSRLLQQLSQHSQQGSALRSHEVASSKEGRSSADWHCSLNESSGKLELTYLTSVITLYLTGRDAS